MTRPPFVGSRATVLDGVNFGSPQDKGKFFFTTARTITHEGESVPAGIELSATGATVYGWTPCYYMSKVVYLKRMTLIESLTGIQALSRKYEGIRVDVAK